MVTGIVIPHETWIEIFSHEFDDLASYQAAVGGYIEPISVEHPHMTIYVNEGGKQQCLPVNRRATALWWLTSPSARGHGKLVGTVVLAAPASGPGSRGGVPELTHTLLLGTEEYKIEFQMINEPKKWHLASKQFDNFFTAALYALELDFLWLQITHTRVIAA